MSRRQKIKSANWRRQQENDPHVKNSRQEGYRSRAVYKLLEIDKQYQLLNHCHNIVDLGSAPGSWSQLFAAKRQTSHTIVAVDLLPMLPIKNVTFIQGNFCDESIKQSILAQFNGPIDIIASDIAPNLTGIGDSDSERIFELNQMVIQFAATHLTAGGHLLFKSFDNEHSQTLRQQLKQDYTTLKIIRPKAIRSASSEFYVYAKGMKEKTQ